MSFIRKLFGRKRYQPGQRIQVCLQCGMPVGEHKQWCPIVKAKQDQQPS